MNLLEHFPDGFTPRKEQETILKEIGEYLDSGYKKIILSAPTGIGKSLVAVTLARALGYLVYSYKFQTLTGSVRA